MSDMKIFKFISEAEVLGELVAEGTTPEFYRVRKPVRIVCKQARKAGTEELETQLSLMPYIPFGAEDSVLLRKSLLVCEPYAPETEVVNVYNRVMGTGIVVPDTKIVTA